jgi:hypothetical protein
MVWEAGRGWRWIVEDCTSRHDKSILILFDVRRRDGLYGLFAFAASIPDLSPPERLDEGLFVLVIRPGAALGVAS